MIDKRWQGLRQSTVTARTARAGAWLLVLLAAAAWHPPAAQAQTQVDADRGGEEDTGLRFTPAMARAFASEYTQHVLKSRYELPDDKRAQAQELVARRFMQLAHKIDKPGRELIERLMEEQLAHQAGSGRPSSMPPAFGKEFAERILPIIPEIHEVARGIGQDVRPLLPLKQQLKMAGDLMAFKATVDGFEATMKKWASGEITSFQDPLGAHDQFEKDETGQTRTLQQARWRAQGEVENTRVKQWGTYIEQFKKLYDLDPAQAATADSILREFTQREERLMADPTWRDRIYEGQLWAVMSLALTGDWSHPARTLIEDQMALRRQSWDDLEAEFKARLESIPTTAQRRAAEEKIARLMQEKGLQLPEGQP